MTKDRKLTMQDYLTRPLLELMEAPDFDSNLFWIALALYYDAPMTYLIQHMDVTWLRSIRR